jgi:hypothetical protein
MRLLIADLRDMAVFDPYRLVTYFLVPFFLATTAYLVALIEGWQWLAWLMCAPILGIVALYAVVAAPILYQGHQNRRRARRIRRIQAGGAR